MSAQSSDLRVIEVASSVSNMETFLDSADSDSSWYAAHSFWFTGPNLFFRSELRCSVDESINRFRKEQQAEVPTLRVVALRYLIEFNKHVTPISYKLNKPETVFMRQLRVLTEQMTAPIEAKQCGDSVCFFVLKLCGFVAAYALCIKKVVTDKHNNERVVALYVSNRNRSKMSTNNPRKWMIDEIITHARKENIHCVVVHVQERDEEHAMDESDLFWQRNKYLGVNPNIDDTTSAIYKHYFKEEPTYRQLMWVNENFNKELLEYAQA